MNRARHLLLAIVLTAVVAAGCSGDDTTDAAEPGSDQPTPGDNDVDSDDAAEPDSTEPGGDEADDTAEPDEAPVDLTASFRGVTADAIEVGIVAIDFDRLTDFGVETNSGDAAAIYTAAIEAINDRGGILGRRLEITTETYLPVGGVEADAVCARLTEDLEVFIVVGAIRLDDVLCYTELRDTAAITISQQNQERIDRSNAPYVSVRGRIDERTADWAAAMIDAGAFDGETVGVLGFADADEEVYNETVAALRDAGIDPVEGLVPASGGDLTVNQAAAETVLERFRSEGVTVTVHASPVADGLEYASGVGYETEWLQTPAIGASALRESGVELSYVDGMLTILPTPVGSVDQPAMADDPAVAECVATIEDRTDEVIDFAIDPEVGNLNLAINACGAATILETALTAAGADLTNDTLAAAFAGMNEFSMAGFPTPASLGPDDFAAADSGELARFSAADGAWEFVE